MDIEFVVPTPDEKPDEPQTERGKQLKEFIETPIPLPDGPGISPRGVGDVRPKDEGVESESIKTLTENLKKLNEPEPESPKAPRFTLDVEVQDPSKIRPPTQQEMELAKLAADDPRVLLQRELGMLPGIDPERAASMSMGLDSALRSVNQTAKREMELARRKARRAAAGKSKKRGKGKRRRRKR